MPPRKRISEDYEADDFIDDDDAPVSKKAKVTKSSAKSKKEPAKKKEVDLSKQKDKEGNAFWTLSAGKNSRRVVVSEFKGTPLISVREYYEKDDEMLPGKKGISLTVDQFTSLISVLPDVEKQLSTMGATIPRPNYDKSHTAAPLSEEENDEEAADEDDEDVKKPRKNFEATSDEDEDD